MPVYEYQCNDCNQTIELRQKFSDEPATICPSCNGSLRKLISSTAFTLKGGGWYTEGYGSGAKGSDTPACPAAGSGGGCAG
ncbi:MAG TPA: zinc ribbon domain-containing protein, partial [Geobacterales bacterium]|nr:zinc ribbon domain-containing protein [Geobacterales bacterium]